MQYGQMIDTLQQRLPLSPEQVEAVLAATVQALGETARNDEMQDLRSQLPGPLKSVTPGAPQPDRSLDEFYVRVADLAGVADLEQARGAVEAVFGVLAQAVSDGQLQQLMDTLPREYQQLVPSVIGVGADAELLLGRIRDRAGLSDLEETLRRTQAVLAVLVQRISQGQAADLTASLPVAVRPELPTNPAPSQSFDADDFLERIQDHAGLPDRASAERLTGIVLSTLREWAPTELNDTASQLPKPLARLIRG